MIWCTHATQAWRQSEAAVWEEISGRLQGPNTLLITHFDKLRNSRDRDRVEKRVRKETGDSFAAVFPLSLSEAIAAGEDMEAWKTSGADGFIEYLVDVLLKMSQPGRNQTMSAAQPTPDKKRATPPQAERDGVLEFGNAHDNAVQSEEAALNGFQGMEQGSRVTPRRVVAKKRSRRPAAQHPEI